MDIEPLANEAREIEMRNKEMSEELNRYFASVFTVEDISTTPELQESQGSEVSVVTITKKVLEKLKVLKVEFAHSPHVYMDFLWVLRFPPAVQRCA
eukprot:g38099.t1